jgi:hypothetical protein
MTVVQDALGREVDAVHDAVVNLLRGHGDALLGVSIPCR